MTDLAFTDIESSGLDPDRHAVWEIAVIRRHPDGTETEHLWQRRLTDTELEQADPEALRINRYHERIAVQGRFDAASLKPDGTFLMGLALPELLFDLQDALREAVLVGSNPGFDDAFLKRLLQAHGRKIGWHYRPIDVATLAAGYLHGYDRAAGESTPETLRHPWSSRALSRAVGVEPPGPDVAHTALGDARWCRDMHDAVTQS